MFFGQLSNLSHNLPDNIDQIFQLSIIDYQLFTINYHKCST